TPTALAATSANSGPFASVAQDSRYRTMPKVELAAFNAPPCPVLAVPMYNLVLTLLKSGRTPPSIRCLSVDDTMTRVSRGDAERSEDRNGSFFTVGYMSPFGEIRTYGPHYRNLAIVEWCTFISAATLRSPQPWPISSRARAS